jgi:hypothetical protein
MRLLAFLLLLPAFTLASPNVAQRATQLLETVEAMREGKASEKPEINVSVVGPFNSSGYLSGDVVLVDAEGVILGEVQGGGSASGYQINIAWPKNFWSTSTESSGSCRVRLVNNNETGMVEVREWANESIWFETEDCQGDGYIKSRCLDPDKNGTWISYSSGAALGNIIARSKLFLGQCTNQERLLKEYQYYRPVPHYMPPEILNAAYPVRLEQLP